MFLGHPVFLALVKQHFKGHVLLKKIKSLPLQLLKLKINIKLPIESSKKR